MLNGEVEDTGEVIGLARIADYWHTTMIMEMLGYLASRGQ